MADIPVYDRRELPPSSTGIEKPPYQLADLGGQIRMGETIAGFAGKIFTDLVETRANNEIHEFLGVVDTAQAKFRNYISANPGTSFENMGTERDRMITEIENAGQKLTLKQSKQYSTDWMAANKELLMAKAQGDLEEIVSKNEALKTDLLLENAVNNRDKIGARHLIKSQAGKVYPLDVAELLANKMDIDIDALIEKDNEDNALANMQNAVFKIASDYGYETAYDFLNAPEITQKFLAKGIPAEKQQQLKNIVEERLKIKEQEQKAQLLQQHESDKENIYATINDPKKSYDDIVKVINDSSLPADEKQQKIKVAQDTIKARAEDNLNPLNQSDSSIYWEMLQKVNNNPDSVKESDLSNLVGKGYNGGISIDQYKELKGDLKKPVDATSSQIINSLGELENKGYFAVDDEGNYIDPEEMTPTQKAKSLSNLINYTNQYRQYIKDNPHATAKQKEEYFNSLTLPVKEQVAKSRLRRLFDYWLNTTKYTSSQTMGYLMKPYNYWFGKGEKEVLTEKSQSKSYDNDIRLMSAPDIKLDLYWPQLSEQQKKQILSALDADPSSLEAIINRIKSAE